MHRQEVQTKLGGLIESWHTGSRPRGPAVAQIAELARRVERCEGVGAKSADGQETSRRLLEEVRDVATSSKDTCDQLRGRVAAAGREADEARLTIGDLQMLFEGKLAGSRKVLEEMQARLGELIADAPRRIVVTELARRLERCEGQLEEARGFATGNLNVCEQLRGRIAAAESEVEEFKVQLEGKVTGLRAALEDKIERVHADIQRRTREDALADTRCLEAVMERRARQSHEDVEAELEQRLRHSNAEAMLETRLRRSQAEATVAASTAEAKAERCERHLRSEFGRAMEAVQAMEDRVSTELAVHSRESKRGFGTFHEEAQVAARFHSDALAKRIGEVHGVANEAINVASSSHASSRELGKRLHEEVHVALADGMSRAIQRADGKAMEGSERLDAIGATLIDATTSLKDDFRRLRLEVGQLRDSQATLRIAVTNGSTPRSLTTSGTPLSPVARGRAILGGEGPGHAGTNGAALGSGSELQRIRKDFGAHLEEAIAELADHVAQRGRAIHANTASRYNTTCERLDEHARDAQLVALTAHVSRLAREAGQDGKFAAELCAQAQAQAEVTCAELAAEQRSLRRDVEEQYRRFAFQLEEVELLTRRDIAARSAPKSGIAISDLAASTRAELARLQRESRMDAEQVARRAAKEEVEHWSADAQLHWETRIDKACARAAEQHRTTDSAQRSEVWRELRELRSAMVDARTRCPGNTRLSIRLGEL